MTAADHLERLALSAALRLALLRLDADGRRRLGALPRLGLAADEAAALEPVERIRRELATDTRPFVMQDFGAGTRAMTVLPEAPLAATRERTFAEVYRRAAVRPVWGRLLFRLARALEPRRVLELGTNLGVGACTLAAALELNGRGRLVTVEGDPTLAEQARDHLGRVPGGERAEVVTGTFDAMLPAVLPQHGPFDLVVLDGHHERAATLRYWGLIRPHLAPGACVVFDDVEPWKDVRAAWRTIRAEEPAAQALDLVKAGLLVLPVSGGA
ncbi:MAG: class I SAM-dependent methyltransferase [Rhodothermales bacterium]|nr:class I SAM-dependent methyltransferase [Rhodothermales bacterium]